MNRACGDLGVFDFSEGDEVTNTYPQWSKVSNPNRSIAKNQLSHCGSAGYVKEVHTVEHIHVLALDDDSHSFIGDTSCGPLHLLGNGVSRHSVGTEMRNSSPFRSSPANGYTSSGGPESASNDGSVDAVTPDGDDSIQVGCPPAPTSPVEDKSIPRDLHAQKQSLSGLEMEETDTVVLHTDYVTYRNKYFPASLILMSKDSIRVKASALEEEDEPYKLEWKIDDILHIEPQWSSVASTAKVKFHILTKDAMPAEKGHDASGVEMLEFLVHDPDWSQRQEWIMSLDMRLNALWNAGMNKFSDGDTFPVENRECSSDPYIPCFDAAFEEVIYPEGDVDAVSISKRDVDLLQPEIFINDTIIDFYMKYLKNEIPPQERLRFHFFNSFFFRKLADLDKNPSSAFDGKAAFQRVRKWTRKVNIFEKDYIFIPVNYNLHWSLLVICYPGEVGNFNDENVEKSLKVPCILHMDSIRGSHMGLKDLIQSYLLEEWKERHKEASEDISSKFLNLRFLSLELPQQENCSDCGLFLLHYAELFIAESPANFNPFTINKFDNFLKPNWFVPAEASLKRVHIQRLIYELLESRSQGNALPSCNGEAQPSAVHESSEHDNGLEILSEKRSAETFWNRKVTYSQSAQGMGMGLLDVSLYRTSQCINDPGMGMTELLGQCQQYDQSASLVRLGCAMSPIREEMEEDEHPACSTLGQTGADLCGGFNWNSELSDHAEPEEDSSPVSDCSSDDSLEMTAIECSAEKQASGTDQNRSQNLEASKENMDSLTESYASASSDMMETPPEDSQEFDKIYGSNYQEDPPPSNPEEVLESSSQELSKNEESEDVASPDEKLIQASPQELSKKDENEGDIACLDDKLVVESSSSDSDEDRVTKRMRLTPSFDGETRLLMKLSNETASAKADEACASLAQEPSS